MKNNKQKKNASQNDMAAKLDRLLSRIPKGAFATVGGALGGPTGAMIGKGISTITGYGDYTVSNNSLTTQTHIGENADQVPVFRQQGADTRIKHCEYVTDVVVPATASDFSNNTFYIDPTSSVTFPWLHGLAKKYQRYKVKGMVIGYRSTSTDYNNNGVVAIAVNYDPAEREYDTMEGLLNNKFAVSCKPSMSMLAPVECDPARSPMDGYYLKHTTSVLDNEATRRQTTMGRINIATTGLSLTPGTTIGQIYISYDIELIYPYLHYLQDNSAAGFEMSLKTTSQATVDADLMVAGATYGNIASYGDPSKKVSDIWVVHNNDTTAATKWMSLIMPPGVYRILHSDGPWYYDASNNTLGGSLLATTVGACINVLSEGYAKSGDSVNGQYTIEVTDGTEADRTFTPANIVSRTQAGGNDRIQTGLFVQRM